VNFTKKPFDIASRIDIQKINADPFAFIAMTKTIIINPYEKIAQTHPGFNDIT